MTTQECAASRQELIEHITVLQEQLAQLEPVAADSPTFQAHGYVGRLGYRGGELTADERAAVAYADGLIADMPEVLEDQREPELYRFVRALLQKDLLLDEIVAAADYCNIVNFRPALTVEQVRAVIEWALGDRDKPTPTPRQPDRSSAKERMVIRCMPQNLVRDVHKVVQAMLADTASGQLLNYGGTLCTVQDGRIVHYDSLAAIRMRALQSVDFHTQRGNPAKGDLPWYSGRMPDDIGHSLIAASHSDVPTLRRMLFAPTLTGHGQVIARPGFDEHTGFYCAFGPLDFWAIEQEPSAARAQRAYTWLVDKLFAQFPFASLLDAAVAVACLLTGLVRPTCGIAPAFMTDAPTQSSGKSALLEAVVQAVRGRQPDPLSWSADEAELTKTIHSELRQGAPCIFWDNLPSGTVVRSGTLARLLTSSRFANRVLSQNRTESFSTDVLVLFSGNNLVLEGDMPSRVLTCRLEPNVEAPEKRTFSRVLSEWVAAHRAEIVREALTIVKAYMAAGAPKTAAATRFPEWSRMVQAPIAWVSGYDVAEKFDAARATDPERDVLRDVVLNWHPALGEGEVVAEDIMRKLETVDFGNQAEAAFVRALQTAHGTQRRIPITKQWLGLWLLRSRGKVVDGLAIANRRDKNRNRNIWRVQRADASSEGIFS